MRKTILFSILCLFLSSALWAAEPVQLSGLMMMGGGQTAAAAPEYSYSCAGGSNELTDYAVPATESRGSPVVASRSGNVTKLGVRVYAASAAAPIDTWFGLYASGGATQVIVPIVCSHSSSTGWQDCTVSSTAVTKDTTYEIWWHHSSGFYPSIYYYGTSAGFTKTEAYGFPAPTDMSSRNAESSCFEYRMYIE
jgi:hypothetical protein